MPSPFDVRGSQTPTQAAALQMMQAGGAPPGAPPPAPAQAPIGAQPAGQNPVAALLAEVLNLIIQRQGQEEDLMAIQQFLGSLQEIATSVPGQAQAGVPPASPSPPLGAGPVPAPF